MHRNKRKTKRHINKHHSVHNQNEKQQYKLIRPPILNLLHVVLGCEFETLDVEKFKCFVQTNFRIPGAQFECGAYNYGYH